MAQHLPRMTVRSPPPSPPSSSLFVSSPPPLLPFPKEVLSVVRVES